MWGGLLIAVLGMVAARNFGEDEHKRRSMLDRIGDAVIGFLTSGEFLAIFREGINDLRQTFAEVVWGRPEHGQGAGVPLAPTGIMVTQDLGRGVYANEMPVMNRAETPKMSLAEFSKQVDERSKAEEKSQEKTQDMGPEQQQERERGGRGM